MTSRESTTISHEAWLREAASENQLVAVLRGGLLILAGMLCEGGAGSETPGDPLVAFNDPWTGEPTVWPLVWVRPSDVVPMNPELQGRWDLIKKVAALHRKTCYLPTSGLEAMLELLERFK